MMPPWLMRFGNRSALENWVAQMKPRREYAKALQPRRFKGLISMDLIRYVVRSSSGVRNRILSAPVVDRLNAVSIRAALSLALAVCLIPKGTAQAELFGPQYRSWEGYDNAPPPDRSWGMGDYEPFSQKRQRAHTKHESRPKAAPQRQHALHREESKSKTKTQNVAKEEPKPKSQEVAKGPLQIIISIADQRISVYDDGTLIARSSVSTGVQGHPTPLGVFSVIGKELWHRSNIYSAAPMPYMQRITWSGIALHAGVLPGHPASHGCIRLAKKPSRSSNTSVLRISAGSLLVPCGAAALMDSNVNAGAGGDDACATRLCAAASATATAKGNDTMRRAAIGATLIFSQLCCPLCVPCPAFSVKDLH